jgi:hypothetical protein
MFRLPAAAALSALLLAAVPAAADAKTFRGKTNQGRSASVVTGADGVPNEVRIAYRAPCRNRKASYRNRSLFISPFQVETIDAFQDGGGPVRLTKGLRAGETARATATLTGQRVAGPEHWTGTFGIRVVIRRGGRTVDVCHVKRVTWTAELAS